MLEVAKASDALGDVVPMRWIAYFAGLFEGKVGKGLAVGSEEALEVLGGVRIVVPVDFTLASSF